MRRECTPRFHSSGQLSRRLAGEREAHSRRSHLWAIGVGDTFLVRDDRQRRISSSVQRMPTGARAACAELRASPLHAFDGAPVVLLEVDTPSEVPSSAIACSGRYRNFEATYASPCAT